jgi:hypothetical protein
MRRGRAARADIETSLAPTALERATFCGKCRRFVAVPLPISNIGHHVVAKSGEPALRIEIDAVPSELERFSICTLPQGRKDVLVEERGSQRLDPRLDFKLEKQFSLAPTTRVGVTPEAFNLLNNDAITSRITRSGSSYFTPTGLVLARRVRLGLVYRF